MRSFLLAASSVCVLAAGVTSPPYASSARPVQSLFPIAEQGRSGEELLCLDSLAGYLARQQPQIYRVSKPSWDQEAAKDYDAHLRDMTHNLGIAVNSSLVSASLQDIVATFKSSLTGFVRSNSGDASMSAALTLAAASDGLLVAANDAVATALEHAGLAQQRDLRGKGLQAVLPEALPKLSTRIFVFQDTSKQGNLGDYAVFARAAVMEFGSDSVSQDAVLNHAEAPAAALGWHGENDFVAALGNKGVYVHAADWSKNLAALSNVQPCDAVNCKGCKERAVCTSCYEGYELQGGVCAGKSRSSSVSASATGANHTVAFLISDGDNIQWTLGGWSTDASKWASPARGTVPCGWTFSPSSSWLAPRVLQSVRSSATPNDELIAGPSGVGYVFPGHYPSANWADFVSLTHQGMKLAGMDIVNVIGQDDSDPDLKINGDLIGQESPGLFYYSWGGGYSGLQGKVWQAAGKPVVSGRVSLWGEDTSGTMVGVQGMVETLKKLPKDPSSTDGYSLIPVHAWSHNYADVLAVADGLNKAGGFDVVLPSELLRRVGPLMTASSGTALLV